MRIEQRVVVRLQLLVAAWLLWPGLAWPAPKPALALAKLEIPASTASAPSVASLVVTVDGLDAASAADPAFLGALPVDAKTAAAVPPTVEFGKPIALAGTESQRSWVLPMTVAEMPPATTMTRYVSFKLGTVDWTLGYQLTSPASVATSWSLKPAPPSTLTLQPDGGGLALNVSVAGTAAIRHLEAVVQLKDVDDEAMLADSTFTLCRLDATDCSRPVVALQGAGTHQLWLKPSQAMAPGKYAGSITVTSADKPLGESANLTVYVTSWGYQLAGVGLVALGVVLSLLFTTFLRHRLTRDQMRLAAALLRSGLDQLLRVLHALAPPVATPEIERRLTHLLRDLSDSELEAFGLPPVVPLPMAPGQVNSSGETFKKRIEALSEWVRVLQVLVPDGVARLHRRRAAQCCRPNRPRALRQRCCAA